jgi:hypothetical protein
LQRNGNPGKIIRWIDHLDMTIKCDKIRVKTRKPNNKYVASSMLPDSF